MVNSTSPLTGASPIPNPAAVSIRDHANRPLSETLVADVFMTTPQLPYQGVSIYCPDSSKLEVIKSGIDKVTKAGFDLASLHIHSSPKHDKKLLANSCGEYFPKEQSIVYRFHADWDDLSAQAVKDFPEWAKNTYSGKPDHLILHEIGHYLHHQRDAEDFFESFKSDFSPQDQKLILKQLGHPYPAQNAGELIAEMFAGQIGGGKHFQSFVNDIYKLYNGPQISKTVVRKLI